MSSPTFTPLGIVGGQIHAPTGVIGTVALILTGDGGEVHEARALDGHVTVRRFSRVGAAYALRDLLAVA